MNRAECLRILGIRSGASDEEARFAYRDLVKVWHPDRFDHDPELRRRAERKLQEINRAWEALHSAQGRAVAPDPPRERSRPADRPSRSRRGFPLLRLVTLVIPAVLIVSIAIWNAGRFDQIWSEVAGNLPTTTAEEAGESTSSQQAIRQVVSALSDRRFIRAGVVDIKRRPADDAEAIGSVPLDEVVVTDDEVFGWRRIVSLVEPSETIGWARVPDLDTLEEIGLPPPPSPALTSDTAGRPTVRDVDYDPFQREGAFVRHGPPRPSEDSGRLPVAERRDAERFCSERHFPGNPAHRECVETLAARLLQSSIAMAGFAREERQTIERECMAIQDASGFSACLGQRVQARIAGSARMTALAAAERASLRTVCAPSLAAGGASYDSCLDEQLARLDETAPLPDLASLGTSDREAVDAACAVSYTRGPSAYRRCVRHQFAVALRSPRRPDLASLDPEARETVESACSLGVHRGPETYNACLWREFRAVAQRRPGRDPTRER